MIEIISRYPELVSGSIILCVLTNLDAEMNSARQCYHTYLELFLLKSRNPGNIHSRN